MGRRIWNFIPCRWSWWESAPLSVAMVIHGKKKKNRKPHTTSCFEFLFLFEGMVPCLLLSSCLQCSGEASRSIMCFRKWGWCLVLKSLLSLVTGYQDHSVPDINVATGSNVTLTISKDPLGLYKRLTWLHTTSQKILEFPYGGEETIFESEFKDRVHLDKTNGALHIFYVRKKDRGTYYMRVLRDTEDQWKINLGVFDPVPRPSIKIEKTQELTDSCHLKLSCEVEVQEEQRVDYTWYENSGPFRPRNPGNVLELIITPQNKSTFYTCQVSNPASSKNDTVYFVPPCMLARSSGVHWIATQLMVMTLNIVIVCIL